MPGPGVEYVGDGDFAALRRTVDALDQRLAAVEAVPRFRAYRNAALALATNNTVVFDTEELDSDGWFSTATGLFTPRRAGTYRFSWALRANVALTADNWMIAYLIKNGAILKFGELSFQRGATQVNSVGSAQATANGTTDTFGVLLQHNNGGTLALNVGGLYQTNFFDGEFVG